MSSLVYPAALPGLTFNNTRSPNYNTGVQPALSGKESCLAYQLYPIMEFDLQYEYLDGRNQSNSDIRALLGLFMSMKGQADTFLFNDPEFNTVSLMPFATTDGVTTAFQTTATYQNVGGPGGAEIIQNFNGAPAYYLNRYGPLQELLYSAADANYALQSQDFEISPWNVTNCTVQADGALAPDGTATGDLIVESSTANVRHDVGQGIGVPSAALQWTFSAFVGAFARSWVALQLVENSGSTAVTVWFNVSTGVIGTAQTGANWTGTSATIANAGGGWYRVSVSAIKTNAATSISAYLISSTGDTITSYAGVVSTKPITIWGAQFEQTAVLTFYSKTTTAVVALTAYTLGATGVITLANTVAAVVGAILNWTGSFFYRCRFTDDKMTVSQFVNKFWENKSVTLRQKKL